MKRFLEEEMMDREKELCFAIRRRIANSGSINIKEWQRGEVIKRDVDPYIIGVRVQ